MIKLVFGLPLAVVSMILYAQLVIGKGKDFAESMAITGAFGDSFGMVTAFASGLAAYLVYKTLVAQKTELDLTRKELQDTRKQQQLHAIENTFYKLIELHHLNLASLKSSSSDTAKKGRDFIFQMKKLLESKYQEQVKVLNTSGTTLNNERGDPDYSAWVHLLTDEQQSELLDKLVGVVDSFVGGRLNTYLKQITTLLGYLEKHSELLEQRQELFTDILRAQLSKDELQLLFYISYLSARKEFDILTKSSLLCDFRPEDFIFRIADFRVKPLPLTAEALT